MNSINKKVILFFLILLFPIWANADEKVVRVAIDAEYAPYEFQDSDGKVKGFIPALLREISASSGMRFEFSPMSWPDAVSGLESGSIDLVNMIRTPQRIGKYEFSEPHSSIEQALFRNKKDDHVTSLDSIIGEIVILQKNDIAIEKLADFESISRLIVNNKQEGFIKLNASGAAAFFTAEQAGINFIKEHHLENIELVQSNLWPQEYCFTTKKGNTALIALLNIELAKLRKSGQYDEIFEEWMVKPDSRLVEFGGSVFIGFLILLTGAGLWNRRSHLQNRKLKNTLQLLEVSEKRYRDLYENSPLGYQSLGADGEFIESNPSLCWMLGYKHDEMVGKWFGDFLTPESAEKFKNNFPKFKAKGEVHAVPFKMVAKDGSIVPVEIDGRIGHDNKGNFKQTHCIITDISSRKRTEEQVLKLSKALEQAGESILITNTDGVIEYVNPAFTAITKYSAEEAIGKTPGLIKSGSQNDNFYREMWTTITSGKVWHGKVINRKKDGSFFPAKLTIAPIMDTSGSIINFVGTHADMTELDEMELKFHQAQKMEAIGTLVGGIAHDFNNMLAGMTGNIYLAKKETEGMPDVVNRLANVEKLSFRAADMIQQLLAFARKGMVSMKPLPLSSYINETLKLLRSSVPENITLNLDISSDSLVIKGDTTQLHQVLMNLMNNACDAVENVDKPCIVVKLDKINLDDAFIKTHRGSKIGRYAHLSVEDNGCGVHKDKIEHLFEPFFTTKEQGKGTGLGLSMVFGAIKTHFGHVDVESVVGKGSTFHIYLPLLEEEAVSTDVQAEGTAIEGDGETILLVDDDTHILETGREVLTLLGYKVLQASNGLEAIDVFTANQKEIALIIMDIVMPGLGGVKAAERIRRINSEIKIVYATGYDKESTLPDISPSSEATILSKPYKINDLAKTIKAQLNS